MPEVVVQGNALETTTPARRRLITTLTVLGLSIVAGSLYATRLQYAPVYLASDEIRFALQARSIAATGRDLNGNLLPLYFSEPGFDAGRDPICIYFTALVLKLLPFSESTIRLPSAIVSVLDVVLMFFLARWMFKRELLAILAAALLALTPGHFIYGRFALSTVYPLPFLLLWLLCLLAFLDRGRLTALFAATMSLGLGVYSYIAFMLMAPIYLSFTAFAIWPRRSLKAYLVAVSGFIIPLAWLFRWHVQHPGRYSELVGTYRLYDTHLNPLQGIKDLSSGFSIGVRSAVYWDSFNPSFLFFVGDSSLMNSTRLVGVFLWPVAIFLMVGIHRMLARRNAVDILVLSGLLTSPIAAVLVAEVALRRMLVMVPFVILIAVSGMESMLSSKRLAPRLAAVALLVMTGMQFRSFYRDYMGDYRTRSSVWFGGNIRDTLVDVMQRTRHTPAAKVHVSDSIPFGDSYWTFYAIAQGREDLIPSFFDPKQFDARTVSGPALLVLHTAAAQDTVLRSAGWRKTRIIAEPNGVPWFAIYEK
jgi:4-amino-4-deoxy-L-arabinose transferase-like glycosyltransferase